MFSEGSETGAWAPGAEESGGRTARLAAALKRLDALPGVVEATRRRERVLSSDIPLRVAFEDWSQLKDV